MRDQLHRAASSVSLAIAEGANASQPRITALHFTRALASGGECAAALDRIEDERAAPAELLATARGELARCMRLTLGLRREATPGGRRRGPPLVPALRPPSWTARRDRC